MDKSKIGALFISKDTSFKKAMQKLNETGERILFVVGEKNCIFGTITDGDIRKGIIKGLGFNDEVSKVMNCDFISLKANCSNIEEQCKQLMIEYEIDRIPILGEQEENIIVDVISWIDVFGDKKIAVKKKVYKNKVVIMAGGKGTRLDPFTRVFPKALIPIGDTPVIERIMNNFHSYGFSEFICTLNYKKEYLKLFLQENSLPYSKEWVEEESSLGTAGSLSLLKDKLVDAFFVTNCDTLLDVNYADILKWHKEHGAIITIIGCHNEISIPFGILHISGGRLDRMLEKPVHDVIINTGVYVMEPEVLSFIPQGKSMNMNELIDCVVAEKKKISVYPTYNEWVDIGQWDMFKKNIKHLESEAKDEK